MSDLLAVVLLLSLFAAMALVACWAEHVRARGGVPGEEPEGTQVQPEAVVMAPPAPIVEPERPRVETVRVRYVDPQGRTLGEETIPKINRRGSLTKRIGTQTVVFAAYRVQNGVWCYREVGRERPSA